MMWSLLKAFFAVNDMYLPLSPTAVLKLVADDKLQFQIRDRVEGFSEWENELKNYLLDKEANASYLSM